MSNFPKLDAFLSLSTKVPQAMRKLGEGKGEQVKVASFKRKAPTHSQIVDDILKPQKCKKGESDDYKFYKNLIPEVVGSSLADSSQEVYAGGWNRWILWCGVNAKYPMVANPQDIAVYLIKLGMETEGVSSSLAARAHIRHYHKLARPSAPSPTDDDLVCQIMAGIKRIYSRPVSKKKPLTPSLFKSILDFLLFQKDPSFINLRLAVLLSLQYLSMARWEEVSNLSIEDVTLTDKGNLSLRYKKAKNNQFGSARMAAIATIPDSKYDPVRLFLQYRKRLEELARLCGRPVSLLFTTCESRVVSMGVGVKTRTTVPTVKPWSYDAASSSFKTALASLDLDLDPATYGMHSPRIGAASSAFNSGEMSETQLQVAGRWVSELTPRTYIIPDEDSLMVASRILLYSMLK